MLPLRSSLMLLILVLLAACAPAAVEIPTAAVLPTATAAPPTAVPPTLPPTWTPSPVPSATPVTHTPTLETVVEPVRDRLIFVADGAVQAVSTAPGSVPVALTGPMEARDLTLSPEGQRLAFVGAGLGSGREVYVLDLESGDLQQVTSLGYADVVDPAWRPNGITLTFAAGPYAGREREVYTVRADGGSLRQRTSLGVIDLSDPVFTPDGRGILFAAPGLFMLDIATGRITTLTFASGGGNNASARWRPGTGTVVYIEEDPRPVGYPGGPLRYFDPDLYVPDTEAQTLVDMYVQAFVFSADGRWMAFTSDFGVYLMDFDSLSMRQIAETGNVLPRVAISPDGSLLAYLTANIGGGSLPQIVVSDHTGRDRWVVTDVTAQVVGDMLWVGESGG